MKNIIKSFALALAFAIMSLGFAACGDPATTIVSISISGVEKTSYNYNDDLDITGGIVSLTYGDEHVEDIPLSLDMCDKKKLTWAGEQVKITVNYRNIKTTFNVAVTLGDAPSGYKYYYGERCAFVYPSSWIKDSQSAEGYSVDVLNPAGGGVSLAVSMGPVSEFNLMYNGYKNFEASVKQQLEAEGLANVSLSNISRESTLVKYDFIASYMGVDMKGAQRIYKSDNKAVALVFMAPTLSYNSTLHDTIMNSIVIFK